MIGAIILLIPSILFAQIELPLNGFYRPGKCIPVRVLKADGLLTLQAAGAIPTVIESASESVVPMLVLSDAAGSLHVGVQEIPLTKLSPQQRTVGVVGAVTMPTHLFEGREIISVPLANLNSVYASPLAWEALDAIVTDTPIEPDRIPKILAAGTMIVARTENKPDATWPWERVDNTWVLRPPNVARLDSLSREAVYAPIQSWEPGPAAVTSNRILLIAVLVLLTLMMTLLIRSKRFAFATLGVAIAAASGIQFLRAHEFQAHIIGGNIVLADPPIEQQDHWTYVDAGTAGFKSETADERPISFDLNHAALTGLQLNCSAGRPPTWSYSLPPHARIAMLKRTITLAEKGMTVLPSTNSPLNRLAQQAYLTANTTIAGEIPAVDQAWPGVCIVTKAPTSSP